MLARIGRIGLRPIYNRIGMELEVRIYAGLTEAQGVEVDANGYPRDLRRYWLANVVESTEEDFPGRTPGRKPPPGGAKPLERRTAARVG